jgi:aspartate kinase
MKLVMKFGGVSVANGERMRHAASLVKNFQNKNEVVAVISALAGMTNQLQEMAHKAAESGSGQTPTSIKKFVNQTAKKHTDAIRSIRDERIEAESLRSVSDRLEELENGLLGIFHLGEVTERSLDYIMSFGERLAAPIFAGMLRSLELDAVPLTGGEAGIITDEKFGNATPLANSEGKISKRLAPRMKKGAVPVVTGYIGETKKGALTTLGRGGSDYTATIIGAALNADEIWLWKETDGIMSTDPKLVPEARTLPVVSYTEAMELSYFGAQVLHPRAMEPAMRKGIPIRVKNVFKPDIDGTVIQKEPDKNGHAVKAISVIKNVALVNLSGTEMVGTPGSAGRIFSALGKSGVNIIMISQGSSERTISMIIDGGHMKKALGALETEFGKTLLKDIVYEGDVCAIAVVGAGMRGTPGVAGRIFSCLGKNGVNVMMIAQGSSEHNISFVIKKEQAQAALRAVHDEFELNRR